MASKTQDNVEDFFSAVSSVGTSVEIGGDFDTVKTVKTTSTSLILLGIGIIIFIITIWSVFKVLSVTTGGV